MSFLTAVKFIVACFNHELWCWINFWIGRKSSFCCLLSYLRCYLMLLNNNYIATGNFSKILKICISKCKSFFKYPPFFISAGCNHDAKSNNNIIMNLLSKVKKDKGQNLEEMTVSNNIIFLFVCKTKNGSH